LEAQISQSDLVRRAFMRKSLLATAIVFIVVLVAGAIPATADSWASRWCKYLEEASPDYFYYLYDNIGDCVSRHATYGCRWLEENHPDYFYSVYDSVGDCASESATFPVVDCKYWEGTDPASFYGKYNSIGACVSDWNDNNYASQLCRSWRANSPDFFYGQYKNLGQCVNEVLG
jgi:hypothetical protein